MSGMVFGGPPGCIPWIFECAVGSSWGVGYDHHWPLGWLWLWGRLIGWSFVDWEGHCEVTSGGHDRTMMVLINWLITSAWLLAFIEKFMDNDGGSMGWEWWLLVTGDDPGKWNLFCFTCFAWFSELDLGCLLVIFGWPVIIHDHPAVTHQWSAVVGKE